MVAEALHAVFERFATFGNRSTIHGPTQMDSRACQKLARDCGLLDGKHLTSTDIDIIFTRFKTKGAKKITFAQFVDCTREWAAKCDCSHQQIIDQVLERGAPQVNSALANTPRQDYPADPLQDAAAQRPHSQPQSHSTPRGAASAVPRAMPRLHPDWYEVENPWRSGEDDRFYYVHRKTNETTWTVPYLVPTPDLVPPGPPAGPPPRRAQGPAAAPQQLETAADVIGAHATEVPQSPSWVSARQAPDPFAFGQSRAALARLGASGSARKGSSSSVYSSPAAPAASGGREGKQRDIFDRLTDTTLYTGAHKHRFDATGRGVGGDRVAKGAGSTPVSRSQFQGHTNTCTDEHITSISQILRN